MTVFSPLASASVPPIYPIHAWGSGLSSGLWFNVNQACSDYVGKLNATVFNGAILYTLKDCPTTGSTNPWFGTILVTDFLNGASWDTQFYIAYLNTPICPSGTGPNPNPLTGMCDSTCPIPDLSTDPNDPNGLQALSRLYDKTPEEAQLTQQLESNMDGYSLLSNDTQAAEQCLRGRMANKVSDYRVTSTVRTLAYQAHLRKLWDKFWELKRAKPATQQMCSALIAKVEGEMGFHITQDPARKGEPCAVPGREHCIRRIPADPNKDPKHATSLAFDISERAVNQYGSVIQPPATMATEANACNLTWGGIWTPKDRVHFLCCTK